MQDPQLPVTIHKHWFGLFVIYSLGLLLFAAMTVAPVLYLSSGHQGQLDSVLRSMLPFIVVAGVFVILATLVAAYVYSQSTVTIEADRLIVSNQLGLFADRGAELEWQDIEDITETHNGIFATLFGYGVLQVQTAGTREQFIFSMCPDVVRWRDVIFRQHELSTSK